MRWKVFNANPTAKPHTELNKQSPQAKGLVGFWPMLHPGSDTLYDLSNRSFNGTITNTTDPDLNWIVDGERGYYVLLLDGSNDYGNLGDIGTTEPATVSLWFNATTIVDDDRIYSQTSGIVGQGGALRFQSGAIQIWDGGSWLEIIPTGNAAAGTWHHLAIVHDSSSAIGYLDGIQHSTVTCGFDFTGTNFGLGATFLLSNGQYFDGKFDDVRIYNRALTTTEVQHIQSPNTRWDILYEPEVQIASTISVPALVGTMAGGEALVEKTTSFTPTGGVDAGGTATENGVYFPSVAGGVRTDGLKITESFTKGEASFGLTGIDLTWYEPTASNWYVNNTFVESRKNSLERRGVVDTVIGDDQYAQADLSSLTDSSSRQWGVIVRSTLTTTNTCYAAFYSNSDVYLYKVISGSYTLLGSWDSGIQTSGTIRLEVSGSELEVFWNGTSRITATDSSITSGYTGIYGITNPANNVGIIDNFVAGEKTKADVNYTANIDGAGGADAGGTADVSAIYSPAISGGVDAGGEGAVSGSGTSNETGEGGAKAGGVATEEATYTISVSGGVDVGGIAQQSEEQDEAVSGGVDAGGVADASAIYFPAVAGGADAGGEAIDGEAEIRTPSGGVDAGGTADVSAIYFPTVSGGVDAGGDAGEISPSIGGGIDVGGVAYVSLELNPSIGGGTIVGGAINNIYNETGEGGVLVNALSGYGYSYTMSGGVTVQDALWGHYPFDEGSGTTAGDVSGFEYDGTLVNMEAGDWVTGHIGSGALEFNSDDTDDRVDLPLEVLNQADNLTISFWIRTTKTGEQAVVSGANSTNDDEILILFNSDTQVTFYNNTSAV